jgi:uncharacterized protein YggE
MRDQITREDTRTMSQTHHPQALQFEGVTVIGEAVRRVPPERAEFLIEVTASASTVSQALREIQAKTAQVTQAATSLGVHPSDLQPVSLNVFNLYSPLQGLPSWGAVGQALSYNSPPQALPAYSNIAQTISAFGAPQQIGQAGFAPYLGSPGSQPDVQLGSYHARNTIRVSVRETARVGEIVDSVSRAGATMSGSFCLKASDDASARRATLEAAGKDARAKAESLAQATGKQLGEPVAISEDLVGSNGAFAGLQPSASFGFGSAAAPPVAGELEYYARVSASFRLQ